MTFPSLLRSLLLTCFVLALTAGCDAIPESQSWFAPSHVAQKPVGPQTVPPAGMIVPPAPGAAGPGVVMPPPGSPQVTLPPPALAPTAKIKVAILLPLSGQNAALGQAMQNAAQLAVFDVADSHFELMPRDTASNESGSEAAARDAISSGAQFFIGPVFAADVNRVKPIALASGINMLALSSDAALADQNVFVMGFAPGAQVERAINFAHAHGAHNFAAIVPKGAYGDLVSAAFQNAIARNGDVVVDTQTFDPALRDYTAAVTVLSAKKGQIDGLLLPVGGEDLANIAKQLAAAGFDRAHTHVIGTGLWDVPDIGRSEFLLGGWYAASDPKARKNFMASYVKTNGHEPPRLATLAYDATALAALLAKQGGRFDRAALVNPNGFAGVDGIFRLTDRGIVERGLAVLEVTPNGGHVVDPAPISFTAVGH